MQFPQWVIDRVVARQGTLHPFNTLKAKDLAFVVIDMQNYFLLPEYQGYVAGAEGIIPVLNRVSKAVREAGGTVVWIQTNAKNASQVWSRAHNEAMTPERKERRLKELAPSADGYRLHAQLDVQPADLCVDKISYSAMIDASSELPRLLRQLGISTLLIGGTTTNVCCESTARDAMMQDYRTIMVSDALVALSQEEHEQSLQGWILYFGDVLSSTDIISRLER